jgi:hypothetical protein
MNRPLIFCVIWRLAKHNNLLLAVGDSWQCVVGHKWHGLWTWFTFAATTRLMSFYHSFECHLNMIINTNNWSRGAKTCFHTACFPTGRKWPVGSLLTDAPWWDVIYMTHPRVPKPTLPVSVLSWNEPHSVPNYVTVFFFAHKLSQLQWWVSAVVSKISSK